jgi:hypothetical protein
MAGNADHARELLMLAGLNGSLIKIGRLPATPDVVMAIVDAPGQSPNPKWLLDYPAIQVLVRSGKDNYDGAYTMAKSVKDALLGLYSTNLTNGDRWVSCLMRGDINYIGPDENSRPMFSLNFGLITQPAPGGLDNREPLPD